MFSLWRIVIFMGFFPLNSNNTFWYTKVLMREWLDHYCVVHIDCVSPWKDRVAKDDIYLRFQNKFLNNAVNNVGLLHPGEWTVVNFYR